MLTDPGHTGTGPIPDRLILANLPVEVVDDFAGGLAETGLPSLFSPTIEGGCMSFIIPPSCFGLITATASGFSFEFEGDEWAFPEMPHSPPEIYYAVDYASYAYPF